MNSYGLPKARSVCQYSFRRHKVSLNFQVCQAGGDLLPKGFEFLQFVPFPLHHLYWCLADKVLVVQQTCGAADLAFDI